MYDNSREAHSTCFFLSESHFDPPSEYSQVWILTLLTLIYNETLFLQIDGFIDDLGSEGELPTCSKSWLTLNKRYSIKETPLILRPRPCPRDLYRSMNKINGIFQYILYRLENRSARVEYPRTRPAIFGISVLVACWADAIRRDFRVAELVFSVLILCTHFEGGLAIDYYFTLIF